MACFSPLSAWQTDDGDIVFAERGAIRRPLLLPCGQCIGCRLERSRQWAVRCMHEKQCHEASCFVTLTYDDDHLPEDGSLVYYHFQSFMKRLRAHYCGRQRIRFYMCGEYGETTGRPHFHAILYGINFFDDRYEWRKSGAGFQLYRSPLLEALWMQGNCEIGEVTFESAAYVARYVMKKVTGEKADEHYRRVKVDTGEVIWLRPEFTKMSLKPGIGKLWFDRYKKEVFPRDEVVMNGRVMKPPRYYSEILRLENPVMFDELSFDREKNAEKFLKDSTPARLADRAVCAKSRLSTKVRGL